MREREREREGGGGREGRAIHVLLIHSIFVVAFILFFLFSILYVQCTYSAFVTKLISSAVTSIDQSNVIVFIGFVDHVITILTT